ncbi:MAG: sigma-70 family RNA polymerase sigma factor [Flavobacteriales bacterium]|nr:sigma-70 family RNA polymerase sigma factor [Flavobacteriales bacterium]
MDALVSHTLIQRCLEEDKRAQSELYKIMYKTLIGLCWRYASDKEQAIEYMNLGFVRILLNLKQYRPDVPFEMWARRVTINTIINEFRKNKNWNEKMVRNQENLMRQEMSDSDLSDYQQELLELVRSKALKLPPMTLRVFNLYAIDGYQHTEIAEMLGISEGTSAWHYSDAKKKIRQMLGLSMAKASND